MADRHHPPRKAWTRVLATVAISVVLVLQGCDFNVSNPGPVADENLNNPAAYEAIVNGIPRQLNYALNIEASDVAIRTRELFPVGNHSWVGVTYDAFQGASVSNPPGYLDTWGHAQEARFIGEDALRRFKEQMDDATYQSSEVVARAHLWTAYAYRLMGEYFCQVAFDNGPAQPASDALDLAEQHFTEAMQIAAAAGAGDMAMAAQAGRASVRVDLGNWDGAVSDAGAVDDDFQFELPYYDTGSWRYYNNFLNMDNEQSYTVWNTPYEDYYPDTGDPRTPWEDTGVVLQTDFPLDVSELPYQIQKKYDSKDSPIELSSGAEMRLIEAEAMLRDGRMDDAMSVINEVRGWAVDDPWPDPAGIDEAWSDLKRERGIQLWLQGRRLADFKRWRADGTPGALAPEEMGNTMGQPDLSDAAMCMPIPQNEIDANPNL